MIFDVKNGINFINKLMIVVSINLRIKNIWVLFWLFIVFIKNLLNLYVMEIVESVKFSFVFVKFCFCNVGIVNEKFLCNK